MKKTTAGEKGSWGKAEAGRWLWRSSGCLLSFCLLCSPISQAGEIWTCCVGQWVCAAGLVTVFIRFAVTAHWCLAAKLLSCRVFGRLQMEEGMQHCLRQKWKEFHGQRCGIFLAFCSWVSMSYSTIEYQDGHKDQHNFKDHIKHLIATFWDSKKAWQTFFFFLIIISLFRPYYFHRYKDPAFFLHETVFC